MEKPKTPSPMVPKKLSFFHTPFFFIDLLSNFRSTFLLFISSFEYLTPLWSTLKCLLFFYWHPSRCQFIVYTLFTELLSQVSSTWPHCGPIQLVDHVLVRKDFWIFWITSHMFSAPFSLLLLYHKKQWKRSRKPSIYKGFQVNGRIRVPWQIADRFCGLFIFRWLFAAF